MAGGGVAQEIGSQEGAAGAHDDLREARRVGRARKGRIAGGFAQPPVRA